jgi:hypothetical protein
MPGSIDIYDQMGMESLSVGAGVLLPMPRDDAVFFDGTTFHYLDPSTPALDRPFTPRAEELAAIGTPIAVFHGVVLGERGMLHAIDATIEILGPRLALYADLFGDPDARLGPVAVDSTAYVIRGGDGSAKLYNAPFIDYCE